MLNKKRLRVTAGVLGLFCVVWFLPKAYSAIDKTYEQLKILVDVLGYIQEDYVEVKDVNQLIYGAAHGMVGTLDDFSQFMEPQIHKEVKTETEGEFGGLGIKIGLRDAWLTVITPQPDTPAYRAGIMPNDRIVKIDSDSTKGIDLMDAVFKLRGKPGTVVNLTIARTPEKDGDPWTTHEFAITREIIKIETVSHKALPDHIGYVRVTEFNAHTAEDVGGALNALKKDAMEALVLDLRYNPGGLLTSAVDVASNFLGQNKLIVYTQGRKAGSRQDLRAGSQAAYGDLPMVVLVNGGSASGSEIVAGALQDHRRAVLIGARTFGKASVQSVIPLSGGAGLRLTVAKYYTPSGRAIMRDAAGKTGGITPDITIEVPREAELKLRQQTELIYEQGKESKSSVKKEEQVRDEVLARAVELLKARDILSRLQAAESKSP